MGTRSTAGKTGSNSNTEGKESSETQQAPGAQQTLEAQKDHLTVELAVYKEKVSYLKQQLNEAADRAERAEQALQSKQADIGDALGHTRREAAAKDEQIASLELRTKELNELLSDTQQKLRSAENEKKRLQKLLEEQERMSEEKAELEETVKRQDNAMEEERSEKARLQQKLSSTTSSLEQKMDEVESLRLQASGGTSLSIVLGDPWLITRRRRRIRGDIPLHRHGCTLTLLGSKLLALFGGFVNEHFVPKSADVDGAMSSDSTAASSSNIFDKASDDSSLARHQQSPKLLDGGELRVLNAERLRWEDGNADKSTSSLPGRSGHTTCALAANKLVTFGGQSDSASLNDTHTLNIDTQRWQMPLTRSSIPSRHGHAACISRERMYVFGGCVPHSGSESQSESGTKTESLVDELACLDFETAQWRQLHPSGSSPGPLRGAAMCSTQDERMLLVFGGFDGKHERNDLSMLDLDRMLWIRPHVTGTPPHSRENHSARVVGDYLIIAGGTDGHRAFTDVWAMNITTMSWEQISEGIEPDDAALLKPFGSYCVVSDRRIFITKPSKDGGLKELEMLDLVLPRDIQARVKASEAQREEQKMVLELLDNAATTPNSIEVQWRSPRKAKERIDHFKLMMASSQGVVKEVCHGKFERFKVTNLRPNTEYIFCVKAVFDDGSFYWSDSKAFTTKYHISKRNEHFRTPSASQ